MAAPRVLERDEDRGAKKRWIPPAPDFGWERMGLMGGVFFGLSLHWEIAQFADAGAPAIDVLRMATLGGATLVGAEAELGSLAPGKLADIVLLDANPLEHVRHTQRIWQVIKGGRVYDPARMRPGISSVSR